MYTFYLKEEDMLKDTHFPVIALFNEAANQDIHEFYRALSNGEGCGYDYAACYFWQELDDFDKQQIAPFDGICVETETGERVVVPYQEWAYYLKLMVGRYQKTEDSPELNQLQKQFCNRYCIC